MVKKLIWLTANKILAPFSLYISQLLVIWCIVNQKRKIVRAYEKILEYFVKCVKIFSTLCNTFYPILLHFSPKSHLYFIPIALEGSV